jgi:hypothetical protein
MLATTCEAPGCGVRFEATRRTRRFCSDTCRKRTKRHPAGRPPEAQDAVAEAFSEMPYGNVTRAALRAILAMRLSQDELAYPQALIAVDLAKLFDARPSASMGAELRRTLAWLGEEQAQQDSAPSTAAVAQARAGLMRRALGVAS